METIWVSIHRKKFVNRGFLLGPYCPIYGLGATFITLFLEKYKFDPLVLFVMAVLSCGVLEYLTSWAMEIIFKARWWDYSDKKFNLNGRVCLNNLIAFGVLGLLVIYALSPFFMRHIEKLNISTLNWISTIVAVIYIVDSVLSFVVIFGFRKITKTVNQERYEDNTEQITSMVRSLFAEQSFLNRRFINAYPKLEAIKIKVKEMQVKIKENVNEVKDNINEKTTEIKDNIIDNFNKTSRTTKASIYLSKKKLTSKFKKKGK